jgi:hypothetical protein
MTSVRRRLNRAVRGQEHDQQSTGDSRWTNHGEDGDDTCDIQATFQQEWVEMEGQRGEGGLVAYKRKHQRQEHRSGIAHATNRFFLQGIG